MQKAIFFRSSEYLTNRKVFELVSSQNLAISKMLPFLKFSFNVHVLLINTRMLKNALSLVSRTVQYFYRVSLSRAKRFPTIKSSKTQGSGKLKFILIKVIDSTRDTS